MRQTHVQNIGQQFGGGSSSAAGHRMELTSGDPLAPYARLTSQLPKRSRCTAQRYVVQE